jgi:hypothetical protein
VNSTDRYQDVLELIFEMEHGADRASPINVARMPLYDRNPLLFWKVVSAVLALLLAGSIFATLTKNSFNNARPTESSTVQQKR